VERPNSVECDRRALHDRALKARVRLLCSPVRTRPWARLAWLSAHLQLQLGLGATSEAVSEWIACPPRSR
jgi:hypothetical protein